MALRNDHPERAARRMRQLATIVGRGGESSEKARELLNPSLADGTAPVTVHMILGTQGIEDGNLDQGNG